MRMVIPVLVLAGLLAGCSASNSEKQKQWPDNSQAAQNQKSTNTETGPNTPAGGKDQNDNHTQNITKPADQNPNPEAAPGDVSQGNNKNPKTQGTTSGPNPKSK